jgi:hypothetical protein
MDDPENEVAREERAIHLGLVLVGLPVVIAAVVRGQAIGAGDTIGGALAALGLIGLVRTWRRGPKLPKARARQR